MDAVRTMLGCMTRRRGEQNGYTELLYDDKMGAMYSDHEPYAQHDAMTYSYQGGDCDHYDEKVEEIAQDVARLLWEAEWNDDALQSRISEAVGDQRWTRKMVEECLDNVIEYVERGRFEMGAAMCAALDKATDTADEEFAFPRRHPQSLDGFIAIVSVGVLAEMQGAWVLELLGFGEVQGKEELNGAGEIAMLTSDKIVFSPEPKPSSFAAWWSREYDAYIPHHSIYSYLINMDMVEVDV
ncbi:ESX-4 secretion system protein EccC4 [Dichotomopilus funicola]|uniref:ESX-4 secretion system protein EccC4 n=1 Tax=Dichotomopilus funicola TaxID=1934379 RepID=A0AAN6UWE1_9PEZI|nr:ESX-4 secretion system protein EccC4 [Dichotomopilus funicola]